MSNNLEEKIVNYWNRQPCNINHSKKQVGSVEYFEEVTAKRYRAEPHILNFAEFHKWRGLRVLEIGCGIGTDAEQFARHGAEYYGLDISRASVDICVNRFATQELKGRFFNLNLLDISDSELQAFGKFDLIYSYGVIHHFPNIEEHIARIGNLLNDCGEFRFMVYAKNSWKYAMIQSGLDQFEAQAECPYAEAFTKEDIVRLLSNFDIHEIKQDHCFMWNIPKYKAGIFELEPWFAAMDPVMHQAIRDHLGWHLLVKATKA